MSSDILLNIKMERVKKIDTTDLIKAFEQISRIKNEINDLTIITNDLNDKMNYTPYMFENSNIRYYFNGLTSGNIILPSNITKTYFINVNYPNNLNISSLTSSNYQYYFMNCIFGKLTFDKPNDFKFAGCFVDFLEIGVLNTSATLMFPTTLRTLVINSVFNTYYNEHLNLTGLTNLNTFTINQGTLPTPVKYISIQLPGSVNAVDIKMNNFRVDLKIDDNIPYNILLNKFIIEANYLNGLRCFKALNMYSSYDANSFRINCSNIDIAYLEIDPSLMGLLKFIGSQPTFTIYNLIIKDYQHKSSFMIGSSWNSSLTNACDLTIKRLCFISGPYMTSTDFINDLKKVINPNLSTTITILTGLN